MYCLETTRLTSSLICLVPYLTFLQHALLLREMDLLHDASEIGRQAYTEVHLMSVQRLYAEHNLPHLP